MSDVHGRVAICGRAGELVRIRAARVAGRSILVCGPIGVGKTRLLSAVMESAEADQWEVGRIRGSERMRDVALWSWSELIGLQGLHLGPNFYYRQVIEHAHRLGSIATGLLVVDDAHWLDSASFAAVIEILARRVVPVVIASRPDADLIGKLLDASGERDVDVVDLAGLCTEDGAEVAAACADGRLPDETLAAIVERAAGNPLFIRELVLDAIELAGRPHPESLRRSLGRSAAAVIASRLGRLGKAELTQLQRIAVSEPIGLWILEQLGSADSVTDLERRGLLSVVQRGLRAEVMVAHPLISNAVQSTTSAVTLRLRTREVADALEATGMRRDGDALKVATLCYAAGSQPAAPVAARAALSAIARGGFALANRLARDAYQQQPSVEHAQLLAWSLFYLTRVGEAATVAEGAAAFARSEPERITLASFRMILALHGQRDVGIAQRIFDEIDGTVTAAGQLTLEGMATGISLYSGHLLDAIGRYERLRDTAERTSSELLWAATPAAIALTLNGRPSEAATVLNALRQGVDRLAAEFPTLGTTLDCEYATALAWDGDLHSARQLLADRLTKAVRHSVAPSVQLLTLIDGLISSMSDDFQRPMAAMIALGPMHDSTYAIWVPYVALHLAACAFRCRAASAGDEMLGHYEATKCAGMMLCEPTRMRALGERALALDLARDAIAWFADGAATANAQGNVTEHVMNTLRLAAAGGSVEVAALRRSLSALQGRLGKRLTVYVDHVADDPSGGIALRNELAANGYAMAARDLAELPQASLTRDRALVAIDRSRPSRTLVIEQLTEREREVANLVATGQSDAQVAETLGVSIRTVHAHLRAIYAKLGLTARAQLRSMLG